MKSIDVKEYIEEKFKTIYDEEIINGRTCFNVNDSFLISVDTSGSAVVLMYADTIDDAEIDIFDDGDMYSINMFSPDEIFEMMLAEVQSEL